MMSFSIVIPTYNGADFVALAIESALSQTRPADEVIVSDDGSTDQTMNIVNEYGDKIKVFCNPNGPSGFVQGWNNAISHATMDFISILHQDDLLAPTYLEEAEKALIQYPKVKHLFVPCNYIDENGEVTSMPDFCDNMVKYYTGKQYVKAYYTLGSPHIHRCPGVITHRDVFKVCPYRPEAGHIADDDFFYRVGQYTDVIGLMKPLASYRMHSKSETGHIGDLELSKRLLRDYDFQLKHFNDNALFDDVDRQYFKHMKCRFLRRVLGYGMKEFNLKDIAYAIRYA